MFLRAGFFVVVACSTFAALADSPSDTVTIPLKDIWALEMRGSGTKDVVNLEPDEPGVNSFRERIAKQLGHSIPGEIPPKLRSGFAVSGTGHTALEEARAVFEDRKKPDDCFPSNCFVSVIFSSLEFSWYVRLTDVERQGNKIQIHYQFVLHVTQDLSQHFAIIPFGKLPDGKYQVEMIQDPVEKQFAEFNPLVEGKGAEIICKPFSFLVGCHRD